LDELPENCKVGNYSKYTRLDIINYLTEQGFVVEVEEVDWSNSIGFFRAIKNN
jgi:hypothetical protein